MFDIVKKTETDMLEGIDPQAAKCGMEFLDQIFSNLANARSGSRKETD